MAKQECSPCAVSQVQKSILGQGTKAAKGMRKGQKMARWQRLNRKAALASRDVRQRMSEAQRLSSSRPEVKERRSRAMRACWQRPGFREKMQQYHVKAEKQPKCQTIVHRKRTPMERYYASEAMKAVWEKEGYREKMAQAIPRGPDSHAWCGGLSFMPYSLAWTRGLKRSIRERDNYTCQKCDRKQQDGERAFQVHHIDYVKEHCEPENLITLCPTCHAKTNSRREYWTRWFEALMRERGFAAKGEDYVTCT